ncbi:MAG: UpxY family transcription antiterminator [Bacteroidetes bacterium]|jgi:transcription antitermination factor NusG|nr:UpxY family transcription antiterminator [Bacteroidota bacterium]
MSKWLAIYTKPRWEKKVHQLLTDKGIESYCPLNKVKRKWSDRIKTVEEPLFKSYVFVKVTDDDRTKVRLTNGVVNFVYWNGKPAIIREKEIQTIKRFLDEHESVQVRPMEFAVNQQVLITSGTFMDKRAVVVDVRRKEVKVAIESLGQELVAYIDKTKLSILEHVL